MNDETAITDDYLDRLQAICDAATEGPWYAVYTDDKDSMNAVYVGTVERGNEHDNEPGMDGSRCGEIVAATLIQQMPRVDHDTELWDENAAFIAESRTALPQLIAEVRRLRGEAGRVAIGVNDRHGKPIHVGDRMRFDPQEWGGECEFTIELDGGQIVHPGGTSDLSSWCEIISNE